MVDKPTVIGVNPDYVHQPFPYMPSNKDGKPFLDEARKPIILHSEAEEEEFRAAHDDVADRVLPPAPPEDAHAALEAAQSEIEALRAENEALRADRAKK